MTAKEKLIQWWEKPLAKQIIGFIIISAISAGSLFAYSNLSLPKDANEIKSIKDDVKEIKRTVETLNSFKIKTEIENENSKSRMMRIEDKLDKLVDKFIH